MITKERRNKRIALTVIITAVIEGLVALYARHFISGDMSNDTVKLVGGVMGGIFIISVLIITNLLSVVTREPPAEKKPLKID